MASPRVTAYDLKLKVDNHDERIGTLEKTVAVNTEKIDNLEECSDVMAKDVKEMREVLISSKMAIKIGTWIVAGFGVSVIALIWSLITGQAGIIFK
jgi:hypothetical protein